MKAAAGNVALWPRLQPLWLRFCPLSCLFRAAAAVAGAPPRLAAGARRSHAQPRRVFCVTLREIKAEKCRRQRRLPLPAPLSLSPPALAAASLLSLASLAPCGKQDGHWLAALATVACCPVFVWQQRPRKHRFPHCHGRFSLSVFQYRRFESPHADRTMQSCCEPRTAVLGGGGSSPAVCSGAAWRPKRSCSRPVMPVSAGRRLQRTRAELAPH